MIDSLVSGAGLIYDVVSGQQHRRDYKKQQEFANHFAQNAMQIRAEDLKKAGLHPTLAVGGGAPHTPQIGSPQPTPMGATSVQNMLAQKQLRREDAEIAKLHAEVANIKKNTDIVDDDLAVRQSHAATAQMNADTSRSAEDRARDMHETAQLMAEALLDTERWNTELKGWLAQMAALEHGYMSSFGEKIPVTTSQTSALRQAMTEVGIAPGNQKRIFGLIETGRLAGEVIDSVTSNLLALARGKFTRVQTKTHGKPKETTGQRSTETTTYDKYGNPTGRRRTVESRDEYQMLRF